MQYGNTERESPPAGVTLRESSAAIRELTRALEAGWQTASDYIYAQILLEQALPAAAHLFATLSENQLQHNRALAALLRDLGAPHALRTTLRNVPYRLYEDADSHAPVVAARIMAERKRDAVRTATAYHALAKRASTERMRTLLERLAGDKQDHATALDSFAKRLTFS